MYLHFGHVRQFSPVSDAPFLLLACADACGPVTATVGRSHQQLVHVVDTPSPAESGEAPKPIAAGP